MARDINARLDRLRIRRRGIDRIGQLDAAAQQEIRRRSTIDESYQSRARTQPYTRYALGAMQEVGPEYTKESIDTAKRVGAQLDSGLAAAGFSVTFRLQGSVPLNCHIRGVSDVDLLSLDTSFLTYSRSGLGSQIGLYTSPTQRTSVGVIQQLRTDAEKILKAKYPAADVDTSGGKAISISGGSLARAVDVVPSHWHDNDEYQRTRQEKDRTVTILDKKVPKTIDNLPFVHIQKIDERDQIASGGLRKAIRLCKNVKNDAIEEGRSINFPSFDIAATMYNSDIAALAYGRFYELAILAETQRFLDHLYQNPGIAMSLYVPDGSRLIFDEASKYEGLKALSIEMNDLAKEVAKENMQSIYTTDAISLHQSREALKNTMIL